MATAKIVLNASRDIPFNKLVLSQANVRRVKAGVSIEELAEDIARRTLLHSLAVRPVLDAEGAEIGIFEVPVGGRSLRPQPGLRRLASEPVPLSEAEQASYDALQAEYERLESKEPADAGELHAVAQRLVEIDVALRALEDRPAVYETAEVVRAGVFVSVDAEGRLQVDRGYVRPEDEAPVEPVAMPTVAALSVGHLAALRFPPPLRRLCIARDNDAAGCGAAERLERRAEATGIEARILTPWWRCGRICGPSSPPRTGCAFGSRLMVDGSGETDRAPGTADAVGW